MRILCLLPCLFSVVSCAPYSVHSEIGATHPVLGLRHEIRDTSDLRPLRALHLSVRPSLTLLDTPYLAVDSGLGPTLITSPAKAWAVGAEHHIRIRYKMTPLFHPYISTINGVLYGQGWGGTDVSYGFTAQLAVGGQMNLSPRLALTVDYRWFHYSNGMTFHSDEFRQFWGLSKPEKNEGFQNGGIFVGVVYSF